MHQKVIPSCVCTECDKIASGACVRLPHSSSMAREREREQSENERSSKCMRGRGKDRNLWNRLTRLAGRVLQARLPHSDRKGRRGGRGERRIHPERRWGRREREERKSGKTRCNGCDEITSRQRELALLSCVRGCVCVCAPVFVCVQLIAS